MFRVTENLAYHGIGETSYPMDKKDLKTGRFLPITKELSKEDEVVDWIVVDVRDMEDNWNPPIRYSKKFCDIEYNHDFIHDNVVVCCGAGMSRSPSICLGYLLYKGKTWDEAWNMIHAKNSPAEIEPGHIIALKDLFGIHENFTFEGKKGELQS